RGGPAAQRRARPGRCRGVGVGGTYAALLRSRGLLVGLLLGVVRRLRRLAVAALGLRPARVDRPRAAGGTARAARGRARRGGLQTIARADLGERDAGGLRRAPELHDQRWHAD